MPRNEGSRNSRRGVKRSTTRYRRSSPPPPTIIIGNAAKVKGFRCLICAKDVPVINAVAKRAEIRQDATNYNKNIKQGCRDLDL